MYLGDLILGATIDTKFSTVTTAGTPITLAGTPVISAYPDNSTTQLTAGITLTVDFDGVTGLHNVRVVASGANGYAAGSNYSLVITTGTVNGVSVVGYVIAQFSIQARSEAVWALAMVEPTAVPAVTGTMKVAMAWLLALARNKITQTATTQTLRNDADDTSIATSTVSDDATTFTRGEWT